MKDKKHIQLIKTEEGQLLLKFGGSLWERLGMIKNYILYGWIFFEDFTWFGEENEK